MSITPIMQLAINLRDKATAEGKNFKIRVKGAGGYDLDSWLKWGGYNLDGTPNPEFKKNDDDEPIVNETVEKTPVNVSGEPVKGKAKPVALASSAGVGEKSVRTKYEVPTAPAPALPTFDVFYFKDYDAKAALDQTSDDDSSSDKNDGTEDKQDDGDEQDGD